MVELGPVFVRFLLKKRIGADNNNPTASASSFYEFCVESNGKKWLVAF
jgi:hypothetical protein